MASAEESKKTYYFYKERGFCVKCHHRPATPRSVQCPDCLYKAWERTRAPGYRERANENARARAKRFKQEGRCVRCGKELPDGCTVTECPRCGNMHRRSTRRYRERQKLKLPVKPEGTCRWCDKPVVPGKKFCEEHYAVQLENAAHGRTYIDMENHPWRQDETAWCAKIQYSRRNKEVTA